MDTTERFEIVASTQDGARFYDAVSDLTLALTIANDLDTQPDWASIRVNLTDGRTYVVR